MAATLTQTEQAPRTATLRADGRQARPVLWWAGFGGLCGALAIYLFGSWILSADFTSTPPGPTPIPGWMKVSLRVQEIAFPLLAVGMVYWFLVRKWRRERQFNLDSMLVVACIGLYWQDVLYNYTAIHFTYNAGFTNMGSWAPRVPGWIAPNSQRFAEPFLFAGGAYPTSIVGVVILSCWLLRRIKARYPHLGRMGTAAIMWTTLFLTDFICESAWVHSGAWSFGGAIKGWTLFYGKWYQLPVYNPALWAVCLTGIALLRHYVDDKGRSVVERGIDRVQVGPRSKTGLRFLAVYGALNAIMLVTYNIPQQWIDLHSSPWPTSIQERSYFTQGLCGPGTDYECFNRTIPLPSRSSSHVSPDGTLVIPNGVDKPKPVGVSR